MCNSRDESARVFADCLSDLGQSTNKDLHHLICVESLGRQDKCSHAVRYQSLLLASVEANILVFRQNDPSIFAGRLEPNFIWSVLRKMVIMHFNIGAGVTEGSGDLQSPERTV